MYVDKYLHKHSLICGWEIMVVVCLLLGSLGAARRPLPCNLWWHRDIGRSEDYGNDSETTQ